MFKSIFYHLWIGFALMALFFYPLAASLSDGLYYMQWKVSHTYELFSCIVIGMFFLSAAFYYVNKISNKYIFSLLIIILSFIPLLSFTIHLCKQLGLRDQLLRFNDISIIGLSLPLLGFIIVFVLMIVTLIVYKDLPGKILISVILMISPVSLVVAATVIQYGFEDTLDKITSENGELSSTLKSPNIYVFVFDELDYNYLYENNVIKAQFENISDFSKSSTNYHNAISPGNDTLTSMPGLLLEARYSKIDVCHDHLCIKNSEDVDTEINYAEHNIFKKAQLHGYRTAIYGWMHSYCEQYYNYLDECRTYSIYNYSSVNDQFSLLNPIYTNIILLPRQFPFGMVKKPIISMLQKLTVNQTYSLVVNELDDEQPLFIVTHFSVPHLPFVFDENGFNPASDPFLQNHENYVKQLSYVDLMFGRLLDNLKQRGVYDKSRIMFTSDHGYRVFLKQKKWNNVPLLVSNDGGTQKEDVFTEVKTEKILFNLFDENINLTKQ